MHKKTLLSLSAALAVGLMTASCSADNTAQDTQMSQAANDPFGARIVNADAEPGNWLSHGRNYQETRNSPLDQINTDNVGDLKLAWYEDLDTSRGQEATPIVVDGVMYTTSAWSKVQAFDGVTGKLLWQFDPKVPGEAAVKGCCDVVNRGVAYWGGKVFVGTFDGRLIAIDAKTGKQVWSKVTVDQKKLYTITGAPRVVKGRVLIGNGGAEFGVRGYITAFDADSGKQLWRFYTVPPKPGTKDNAPSDAVFASGAAKTWAGEWWNNGGGGGTVWDSMSYDPDLDLLYVGVGNGSYWAKADRSPGDGDDLFVGSILALRPETGEYVWHYQATPGDQWDYTSTAHMILADIQIDGKKRKVLMQAPKNGFFFVIDRTNGKLISAEPYTVVNWAKGYNLETGRPDINPDADYSRTGKLWAGMPGALGGHDWQPMAFNPGTGLVYIPEQRLGFPYVLNPGFKPEPLGVNLGVDLTALSAPDAATAKKIRASVKGSLVAWDPVTQKKVWSVPHAGMWNGGVLSTSGGLIFQGDGSGQLSAYDAANGKKLWSFDAQTGIVAPPVSWSKDGKQYISIVVGWGGAAPLLIGGLSHIDGKPVVNRSRVLTFSLDGKATLPKADPVTPQPFAAPEQFADAKTIALGKKTYFGACVSCHGPDAVSGGIAPDLRRSYSITDKDTWMMIVKDGALKDNGMVSFAPNYSPAELDAIRAYVIEQSRAAKAAGEK